MFLPAGYVKLEGATVDRENYPRLVALADKYNLWTSDTTANPGLFGEGDGTDTMVLPNWTGRMAQFAATAGGAVAAGLPNITGNINFGVPYSAVDAASLTASGNGAFDVSFAPPTRRRFFSTGGETSALFNSSGANLSANLSNPIYSSSTTVQPPAINTFAIMRY